MIFFHFQSEFSILCAEHTQNPWMLRVRSSLRTYFLISGIFKCTEHSKTLWRWTLMCSFVSALLSPEASGQQILHKRETEPLIAILMWLIHRRQTHSTEPSQLFKIKLEKKALSTQKMPHKIPSTSAGFAPMTAGAHTAVTIMSSVFHWSGTSSCGQQDKLCSLVGTLRKELSFMKCSFCEFPEGLPQLQTEQNLQRHQSAICMTNLTFYLYFYPFPPQCVHILGTQIQVWCPRISVTKTFSNLSRHRLSTSYCSQWGLKANLLKNSQTLRMSPAAGPRLMTLHQR